VSEFFAHDCFRIKVSPQMCSRHSGCPVADLRLTVVTLGRFELPTCGLETYKPA
jgi:hypothetical protein